MRMTGEEPIAAPRTQVWDALNDPATLRACIPGCQSLEREADGTLRAIVEVKIGPIGARFNGAVTLSDIDAPNGYTITGEGQGGTVGHAKGGAKVRLSDDGRGGTILSYEVNAEVGGRLAQLGGPIIDATAKQLAGRFFRKFGEVVGGETAQSATVIASGDDGVAAIAPSPPSVHTAHLTAAASASFPWGWVACVAVAIVAGFLLGRSAMADWWVAAVAVLLILVAAAGYESGRRGGGR